MKQLRKPAKRLAERLNKRRNLRLTVKLNSGKIVPKTHNPGKGRPIEDLIYASKAEQRALKRMGGEGKKTKHGIRSFPAPPSRAQQSTMAEARVRAATSSGSSSSVRTDRAPSAPSRAPMGRVGESGMRDTVRVNAPTRTPSSRIGEGIRTDRAPSTLSSRADPRERGGGGTSLNNPTKSQALAEGVRSLAEKTSRGISTPSASGSPLNNPATLNPFNNLRDAVTQRQAVATIARQPAEDLTKAAYDKSMVGVEDLSRSAFDLANPPNLGLPSAARGLIPAPNIGPQTNNFSMPSVATRLGMVPDNVGAPPPSSDITSGEIEDLRGPNPSVMEGQIPGFNSGGIRTSFDANLDFLGSRGTDLNTTGMNPDFTRSISNAVRAGELATGEKARITELARDPKIQAQYYANYKGVPVTWEGVTYNPKKKGGLAAPPGASRHQLGAAIDIARGPVRNWVQANAAEFGISQLRPALARIDPVHFQQAGVRPTGLAARVSAPSAKQPSVIAAKSVPKEPLVNKFSPPSNFSAPVSKPPAQILAAKLSGPLTRQVLNLKAPKPPAYVSTNPKNMPPALPASKLTAADLARQATSVANFKVKLATVKDISRVPLAAPLKTLSGYVKQYADAKTGFGSSITGSIADKVVVKEATKAIKTAQKVVSNFQKGTLTKVAALEATKKAVKATEKVQTAFAPTMKPTTVSTSPAKVATIGKMQDRLTPDTTPEPTVAAQVVDKIINNIPVVKAAKRIYSGGKSIATALKTSPVYKEDQVRLANMTPAERVSELSRRADERGGKEPKKLTSATIDKAAKAASTAVAKSMYTSEGYLA